MKQKSNNSSQIEDGISVSDQGFKPVWSFTGMSLKTKNSLIAEEVKERLKYFKRTFKIWKDYK